MMETIEKWTVRSVPIETLELLREVRETSRIPYGMLIAEAVLEWHARLPEIDEYP